jgi:putative Mn2+ efflux pump MntP
MIITILLIAIALAMDAFTVSICLGLSLKDIKIKNSLIIGLYFGFFQGFMPLIGYFLGSHFASLISQFDHWIAFGLLAFIGIKMIYEAIKHNSCEVINNPLQTKTLILLAIATSIDAFAVGLSFSILNIPLIGSILTIGIITFILSFIGSRIGHKLSYKLKTKAEILGGIILIIIGIKILLEHLNII